MDDEQKSMMREVAREAAQETLHATLLSLGIDPKRPLEMQRAVITLFQVRSLLMDPEFARDLAHLRKWRKVIDTVEGRGLIAGIILLIIGGAAAAWAAFRLRIGM